ncbi:hypothetical protein FSW04_05825 [Baekduia soli]|uniref:Uncharacterized protein n=1 Tax=Baekduia soli TaxID=496014 RepID=A0A5B8U2V7_9ACTN|nr:hypothetical protein [Baekduia soli]QEC47155.1 hypothetical protein FSW04_05825 [Baekduia soli]
MLHAISALVLAAEAGGEKSKTAFYIFGGAFVVWALALSVVGMTQATFPTTAAIKRGTILVGLVLMAAAMATAVITA